MHIIQQIFDAWNHEKEFSGVFCVNNAQGVLFESACGHRNRAEMLSNEIGTAFGIASGTKLFTGLAACKLIDEGKLSLDDRVWDIVPHDLKKIDKSVTVYHLLTHTSGIGDYIDEEASGDYNDMLALYDKHPVYLWNHLAYYLPMFNELPAKFALGERFGYSNAGFVLLGLVIEGISGVSYQQYVTENIIRPCKLSHTGFYRMDRLPGNSAMGYVYDPESGEWHTNIFRMPAIGGSDGGIFSCAPDLDRLWRAIWDHRILSAPMLDRFFTPYVKASAEGKYIHYGLGVYQYRHNEKTAYFAVGGDFGVSFFTVFFPRQGIVASALGNTELSAWPLLMRLCEEMA